MRKRLSPEQIDALLEWIAEGLKPAAINERAAVFAEPFQVTRKQVWWYRNKHGLNIEEIKANPHFKAVNTGLALREVRVEKLTKLAELMEQDLFGDLLWTTTEKGVGTGPVAKIITVKEFNRAEVDAYRGVLDDIARELGHRIAKSEINADPTGELHVTFHNPYHNQEEDE